MLTKILNTLFKVEPEPIKPKGTMMYFVRPNDPYDIEEVEVDPKVHIVNMYHKHFTDAKLAQLKRKLRQTESFYKANRGQLHTNKGKRTNNKLQQHIDKAQLELDRFMHKNPEYLI